LYKNMYGYNVTVNQMRFFLNKLTNQL